MSYTILKDSRSGAWKAGTVIAALVAATLGAAQVQAQTAPTTAAADTGGLTEITVTGRYIKENLQVTPLAITAVTGRGPGESAPR